MKINYIAFIAFTLFNKFWTDHWQDSQPSLQLHFIWVACFNFFHILISPSFIKTMILAFLPIEPMFHRCIAVKDFTELEKVRYKCKTKCFSKFYIDEIAMRKKRANLPMHTLQEVEEPKHFSGTFFWRRRVTN